MTKTSRYIVIAPHEKDRHPEPWIVAKEAAGGGFFNGLIRCRNQVIADETAAALNSYAADSRESK